MFSIPIVSSFVFYIVKPFIFSIFKKVSGWGYFLVVECVLSMHKVLDSIPSIKENKKEPGAIPQGLWSQLLGRLRQEACLRPGVSNQSGQYSKTLSQK